MRSKQQFTWAIARYFLYRALIKRFALPILAVYMLDIGLDVGQIAFLASVGALISFMAEVPGGMVADTIGHKRALIISSVGQALAMACYLGETFEWLLLGTVLYWLSATLMTGTVEALFFEFVRAAGRESDHQKYHGQAKGFANGAGIVAMGVAGWAYSASHALPFYIGVAQFLLAALLIADFPNVRGRKKSTAAEVTLLSHFGSAWRELENNRYLFWLVLASGIIGGVVFGINEFEQVLLTNFGLAAVYVGLFYSVKRLIAMLFLPFTHHFTAKMSASSVLLVVLVTLLGFLILPSFVSGPVYLVAVLLLGTVSMSILEVAGNDYMNRAILGVSRATTLSLKNMLAGLLKIVITMLVGFAVTTLSLTTTLLFIGFGMAIVGAILVRNVAITEPN